MTTMISEVYKAFLKASVPEQDAREAAEALSPEKLATKKDVIRFAHNIAILKWMVGATLAGVIVVFVQFFFMP